MKKEILVGIFSVQEFFIGCVAASGLVFIIGPVAFLAVPGCGSLWMFGGTYNKIIRRFGVPFVLWLHVQIHFDWPAIDIWSALAFFMGFAILCIGDGFPDHRLTTKDKGSWLGRFVEKYIDERDYIGGPITKWLIPVIFQVSLIPYWVMR